MSLIKRTVAAGIEQSRAITGDHIHVVDAPSNVSIIIERQNGDNNSYLLESGSGIAIGQYRRITYSCAVAGLVKIQATLGRYIPATNEVLAKIDPANNGVSIDGDVNVTIDEIGIIATKNTVKIDPLNNVFSLSGEALNVDVSGQTVDIAGQVVNITGQTVDVSGQTVDVSGQTVDVSGQTVDVSGQEIKSAPAKTYGEQITPLVVDTTVKVADVNPNRKSAVFSTDSDGRLWRDGTASATKGIPYTAGKLYLIDCEDELFFHPFTGDIDAYLLEQLKT